ncbi:3465_t:CDS:2 [Gigaspora rosea]|nr:3465_t:CDS:2 [Gigaspora rosea]
MFTLLLKMQSELDLLKEKAKEAILAKLKAKNAELKAEKAELEPEIAKLNTENTKL